MLQTSISLRGSDTRMHCLRLTNLQHSKTCYVGEHYSPSLLIVELPKFSNTIKELYLCHSVFVFFDSTYKYFLIIK